MGAVAVGAFVGAFVSAARGGNPLVGAALGAVGGYVGGQFAGTAGSPAGVLTAEAEAGALASYGSTAESMAAANAAAGGAGTVFPVATANMLPAELGAEASFPTVGASQEAATSAPGLINSGLEGAAPPVTQSAAQEMVNPPGVGDAGAFDQAGVGPPGSPLAKSMGLEDPGLWQKVQAWAKENPTLASAALQAGGSTISGIAQGAGAYMTAERRAQLELENKQKLIAGYRDFVQKGSTGGVGVNLNVRPKPNAGLVNRLMRQ